MLVCSVFMCSLLPLSPCCVLLTLMYSVHWWWWCWLVGPIFNLNAKTVISSTSSSSGSGCLQPCIQYAAAWKLISVGWSQPVHGPTGCARFSVCCSLNACSVVWSEDLCCSPVVCYYAHHRSSGCARFQRVKKARFGARNRVLNWKFWFRGSRTEQPLVDPDHSDNWRTEFFFPQALSSWI